MKLFVETELVHTLFEEQFGGIQNFADEWAEQGPRAGSKPVAARNAKTIYTWLNKGLPAQRDTIFSFFGTLGADPVALIDLNRSGMPGKFGLLRAAFMLGGGAAAGGFAPLFELYRPAVNWPDPGIGHDYFGCDWHAAEFVHDAAAIRNVYATITLRTALDRPAWLPIAFHIAYRRISNADGLWRAFGSIINRNGATTLIHENGNVQSAPSSTTSGAPIAFKTFFGPAPAEFRVASLQPFVCAVVPHDDSGVVLHFEG